MSDTEEQTFETVVSGLSREEYDQIRTDALEKAKTIRHTWRQKGFWLNCKSCEHPHASFIGKKNMVGEGEDGIPIFAD